MYIPDLRNLATVNGLRVLAVGWLDGKVSFPRKRPDATLIDEVQRLINLTLDRKFAVHRTRGIHRCNVCTDTTAGSNASILVPSSDRDGYFLTNFLLPHYVRDHQYCPPNEFARALRTFDKWLGPEPGIESKFEETCPEGEAIQRIRLEELMEKYPQLRDDSPDR